MSDITERLRQGFFSPVATKIASIAADEIDRLRAELTEARRQLAAQPAVPEAVAKDALRERLAELAHEQWAGWMEYLFSKGDFTSAGTWVMPPWAVERWQRQRKTHYADLSHAEKESDRNEADKFLAAILSATDSEAKK